MKTLIMLFAITPILFPAYAAHGQSYTQPYYNGLNGNGSYYSGKGGNNYRSFTYSYPTRPYIVNTPAGGFQSYRPGYYRNPYTNYPAYNNYNRYPGFIYPW